MAIKRLVTIEQLPEVTSEGQAGVSWAGYRIG
jgi:hypothetical protein